MSHLQKQRKDLSGEGTFSAMISVVVVTHNRKFFLNECLSSILYQNFGEKYEVIVVDNSSTDGTNSYINKEFRDRIKLVRNNSMEALSDCKYRGFQLSSGDIIAFTDDDCIVSVNWLEDITDSIKDYDIVGGIVLPVKNVKFPWWWRTSLEWIVGINSNPGLHFLPLGSNVAFRRKVLQTLGLPLYSNKSSLKDCLPYGEDNERLNAALKAGFRLRINKNMIVYHRILRERLKFSYFIKRSYDGGKGWARKNPNLSIFLLRAFAFLINPFRFLVTWDINRFFRMVFCFGYIYNYLRKK